MMEQINAFLSQLKTIYRQQGQTGKILIPGVFLLGLCCLCSILFSFFPARNSPDITPSPFVFPSAVTGPTPTALFNFGQETFTPFPTFPAPTAFPTLTSLPTETQTATQTAPPATDTALPTVTPLPPASTGSVAIVAVNKQMEYVDLQNTGNAPVDLSGWKLLSETGNQSCTLNGILQPNEVLRVWARKGTSGFSCRYSRNIWNDSQSDPAVLYNAQGQEVSRSP
ncbi:MAG TPA: lamin tail domain-containing protein [Anaerolineales bacterium]|nr:lamin tail domain-containing protein [Anaerolineales bacterium]